ncbi:nuclear transport factor 2 family protein [Mycolicibacterium rhodesiae]|uniref:Polyketide cyclase n=1 Tax=Mycolicibacterium rhodesiae TaxID=36814 RepID=A0A1X0INK1_MYCRH|nr:nuclear transport factor 2 family protein [Mycolicibacterium rhodesiae]MCV7346238.1 nuclear transport factor 2 family protein [Mycolicibacterium rhodesiae]ORB49935.1 polyketide cyclase [Mycolicibacterium rhodesiae]
MSETTNIAVTRAVYAAVPAGDLATALSHMDPEVRITYYGSDAIPYAGDYHGIDAAGEFFSTVGAHIEIVAMEPWLFIGDGDNLAVWGHQKFLRTATGHTWESEFAHIITLRDGKWLHFRDFMNSALTHQAFTPTVG